MNIAYFDTSAIIKLIRIEVNSESLRSWLGATGRIDLAWVSSALVLTEVLGRFTLRNVDEEILVQAGAYSEPTLRSLDAIHLATARSIADAASDEFEVLITYDRRLADVAKAVGFASSHLRDAKSLGPTVLDNCSGHQRRCRRGRARQRATCGSPAL